MRKLLLTLACVVLYVAISHAQPHQTRRSALGVSVGWQQLKFLDQHSSPLVYRATAYPNIGIHYNQKTNRSIFEMKVSAGKGTANPSKFGPRSYKLNFTDTSAFEYQVSSQFIRANIEIGYLRKLSSLSSNKQEYWVGGTINEFAYYADEVANFPWLVNTVDISPAFQMNYNMNPKHSLGVRVDFAIVSIVTRSVYGLFAKSNKDKNVEAYIKQGTRLATPRKHQQAKFNLAYKYYASPRIALGADYNIKWFRNTYPKTIKAVENRFNINVEYLFQ